MNDKITIYMLCLAEAIRVLLDFLPEFRSSDGIRETILKTLKCVLVIVLILAIIALILAIAELIRALALLIFAFAALAFFMIPLIIVLKR